MPVTPATALLFDQPYVMVQWPILAARLPPPSPSSSKLCAANQGEREMCETIVFFCDNSNSEFWKSAVPLFFATVYSLHVV